MGPDYGSRLQLQKIAMLDLVDIVVVNKADRPGANTVLTELEYRLTRNRRDQKLIATVARCHRDPGVDQLYQLNHPRQSRGLIWVSASKAPIKP